MNDNIKYFFPKVFNRLASEKNRIWEHLPVEKISLWGMGRVPSKDKFVGRLQRILGEFTPEFFNSIVPEDKASIIRCAEQTMNHDFDLLGSGLTHLDPIPWLSDFKSGYTWPKRVFFRKLRGSSAKGSDIKVPWELSRCHHLLWLGEAYLITKDEKYAQEVVAEIDNWIDENPLMYSVNWTCSMDVAIRAVNWMYALNFITESKSFTDKFAMKVYKSLFQHAFFIRNNLEKIIPYSNNHYSSDLVGLLYLGQFFSDTPKGRKWLKFAKREFYNDIKTQVLPSGIHYEKSISYHRLMVELYSYSVYMQKQNGHSIPTTIIDSIQLMYEYVSNYTKPNGYAPLIADNDDGRFLPFVKRDMRRHNYLNDKNSVEVKVVSHGIGKLFGSNTMSTHLYQDAGVAIIRNEDAYLLVSNVGYSRKPNDSDVNISTHTHNDLLSFELNIGGRDIIIDPGTYLYTSSAEDRNAFRSTWKHNTLVVDGEDQNILPAQGGFSLKRNVRIGKLNVVDNVVEGNYRTISGKMLHHRKFDLTNGQLVITDIVEKSCIGHEGHLRFHLAEGVEPMIENGKVVFFLGDSRFTIDNALCKATISEDTWSPSFGVLRQNQTVDLRFEFDNNISLSTIIQWTKTDNT